MPRIQTMTRIHRNARRAALPAALAVVIAIAVAAFFGGQFTPPPPPAIAQGAPANVTARNGGTAGQVVVSWTPASGSQTNRVGWASEPEYQAANAAGNWLEAFNFVDLGAGKRTYTVKRLEPAARHAFIVATRTASGGYIYSSWVYLTTTSVSPAPSPTPCPTAAPGQHPTSPEFCAITGLPLGEGYVEIGEQHSWAGVKLTITRAVIQPAGAYTPINGGDAETRQLPNRPGRRYLRLYVTLENDSQFTDVSFQPGSHYTVDTDAGTAFARDGWRNIRNDRRPWNTDFLWEIPESASIAVLAARPLYSTGSAEFNSPTLFRIPVPAR